MESELTGYIVMDVETQNFWRFTEKQQAKKFAHDRQATVKNPADVVLFEVKAIEFNDAPGG